jgi:hypothetical protein
MMFQQLNICRQLMYPKYLASFQKFTILRLCWTWDKGPHTIDKGSISLILADTYGTAYRPIAAVPSATVNSQYIH